MSAFPSHSASSATRPTPPAASRSSVPAPISPSVSDASLPMRFLASALVTLTLLAAVYPWHAPLLRGSFYDPHLLTFVHVNTLGLIAMVVFGASYQLLPIVLQTPLVGASLARLSWWLLAPGVVAFVAGLGHGVPGLLAAGGTLVFSAVVLYVVVVARTLAAVKSRESTWWHVAVATAALATGASLGLLLALSKHVGFLAGLTLPTLAAHATLMLGGWVTVLLTGVAYRLISMFTLTEDQLREDWNRAELALVAAGAWTLAAGLLLGLGTPVLLAGALLLLVGLGVFGLQVGRLYGRRLRRQQDVHVPFLLTSLSAGLIAVSLLVVGLASGRSAADPLWIVAGWLAIVGWIETAILGFLHKIGPFLTWMHRYAPHAGIRPVPMLEDLYSRRLALIGWAGWTTGLLLGALAPYTSAEWVTLGTALGIEIGAAATLANGVRIGRHWLGRA
ncbi:MAG: hypothetical protein IT305_32680 [Chloroflexi bacterium]|nr:hypothetical protein [Chloroflexota bacterium]